MGRRRDTPDFRRSNKFFALDYHPTQAECALTRRIVASTGAREREALGQRLLDNVCRTLGIERARLRVLDEHQPHRMRGGRLAYKEYGVYYFANGAIGIANLTAVRGQVVAGKTFLDTLLHELMHHVDRKLLGIPSTPHSPGFYARIENLKAGLMGAKGKERPQTPPAAWRKPPNLRAAFDAALGGEQAACEAPRGTPATQAPQPARKSEKPPRSRTPPRSAPQPAEETTPPEPDPQLGFDFS